MYLLIVTHIDLLQDQWLHNRRHRIVDGLLQTEAIAICDECLYVRQCWKGRECS